MDTVGGARRRAIDALDKTGIDFPMAGIPTREAPAAEPRRRWAPETKAEKTNR